MPPLTTTASENQRGSSVVSMAFRGRSVLSLRRNQVVSISQNHEEELQDLDLFQSHVADRLLTLASPSDHTTLSLPFLHKVLDSFLSCEEEFRDLLSQNPCLISKSQAAVFDLLLDRAVKALDILNELTRVLQPLRHWNRHADIAASALARAAGEAQLSRARKALAKLLASSADCKGEANRKTTERAWSFLSRNYCPTAAASNGPPPKQLENSSSRWLARSWSGTRQLQAMAAGLSPPRGSEAGGGMGFAVYTMSSVLVFTMWALVAAFPGASGVCTGVAPARQAVWGTGMVGVEERVGKGRGLGEVVGVERLGRELAEAVELERGEEEVVVERARELGEASRRLEEGLVAFERRLREVFHKIARGREEVMRCLEEHTSKSSPPFLSL